MTASVKLGPGSITPGVGITRTVMTTLPEGFSPDGPLRASMPVSVPQSNLFGH
ncbi:MAG: hypothetical protein ACXWZM_06230 [Solirubrobacterales bacterium]